MAALCSCRELRQYAGILERPDDQTVVVVRVK
jgi:hypothetical protein